MKETKTCPYCGGEILAVAKKCKHCGQWLDKNEAIVENTSGKEITNDVIEIVDNSPVTTSTEIESHQSETGSGYRRVMIGAGIGVIVLVLLVCIAFFTNSNEEEEPMPKVDIEASSYNNKPGYESDGKKASEENEDRISVTNEENESYESTNDEIDYWSGRFRIDGCIYRLCDSRVFLELEKSGDKYIGSIYLLLGYRDEMERITMENGELKGQVTAKVTNKGLLVSMSSYKTVSGEGYDIFNEEDGVKFKEGDQIFLITYSNSSYTTKTLGKMERFFDGCTIDTFK